MRFLSAALAAFFFSVASVRAVDDLSPPLGLNWKDSPERVEQLLRSAKAKIVFREKKDKQREVWTVEGLIQPGLQRALFTFRERSLTAVELQYEFPNWGIEKYNQRVGEVRRFFDNRFGKTGTLVLRSRDTDTEVIQTLVGYRWVLNDAMLELFYFSAQQGDHTFRTISYTYKLL